MSSKFGKGDRVGIVSGKSGQGMRGEVFWIGESRYGKGSRYGVRGDDGEKYWIDEQHLGMETDVPEPQLPERDLTPLAKGTRVRITRGEGAGAIGEIFWVGESKFGQGMRYGVRAEDGDESYWVDGPGCEPVDEASTPPPVSAAAPRGAADDFDDPPRGGSPWRDDDDAPPPDDDDAPFEGEIDDDEPPF